MTMGLKGEKVSKGGWPGVQETRTARVPTYRRLGRRHAIRQPPLVRHAGGGLGAERCWGQQHTGWLAGWLADTLARSRWDCPGADQGRPLNQQ